jgi:hypothetical protein
VAARSDNLTTGKIEWTVRSRVRDPTLQSHPLARRSWLAI